MDIGLKKTLIRDVDYRPIEDFYEIQSFSDPDKYYLIMCHDRINRKDWTCTCLNFMFRNVECKHIKRIKFIDECRLKTGLIAFDLFSYYYD